MAFVHLHTHTDMSPKDAIALPSGVVAKVAADGQPAVAISDHGSLGAIWELRTAAEGHGIKPIPAFESYLALSYERTDVDGSPVLVDRWEHHEIEVAAEGAATDGGGLDGAAGTKKVRYHHLTVLAKNLNGWSNLVQLHNRGYEDHWHSPRIDYSLLSEHRDGIIALTGCLGGPLQQPLMQAVPAMQALHAMETGAAPDDPSARIEHKEAVERAYRLAGTHLQWLIDAVGRDNVFIEVMYHGIDGELEILDKLWDLADEYGIRCVATGDSHCLEPEHEYAQDAWLAIGAGKKMADPARWRFSGSGYHVKTEQEMRATGVDHPLWRADRWDEACSNTVVVADMVEPDTIPPKQMRLPKFPTPPGYESSTEFFEKLVWEGAEQRWGADLPDTHRERIEYELEVIKDKGFPDYFLITQDVINWCRSDYTAEDWVTIHTGGTVDEDGRGRKKPIRVGPGRGSGAGSAVSYCMNIVGVDPIEHDLLFERFLSPDSVAMPDIDTDFEVVRRPEVLAFLRIRWGADHVAQIGTYSGSLSKASIKSAARTLGLYAKGEELSDLVPMKGPSPRKFREFLPEDSEHGGDFRRAADCEDGRAILEIAVPIEGARSNESIHASAVLISSEPLTGLVPLRRVSQKRDDGAVEDVWVTRWEGPELEDFGMLKFDVLGLRNLDVITRCIDLLAEDGIDVDLESVDTDDLSDERVAATWRTLAEGRTSNVFQMDGAGMTRLLTTAHPNRLEDLSSVIALYRPGPMGENQHTLWASIKAGHTVKSYRQFTDDPGEEAVIASVLDATQGVIALQEQLMQLAERISGFGPYAKSALRKAVSKKKKDVLDKLEPLFIDGGTWVAPDGTTEGVAGGQAAFDLSDGTHSPAFARDTLETLWRTFKASGEYLFNKSHSIAYAQVGFWTAYLKASWPREYAAAVLVVSDKDEHRSSMLAETRALGIEVLPPDIDSADVITRVIDGRIVYGLSETKRVSTASAKALIAERERAPFEGFSQTVQRLVDGGVSPGDIEHLIAAGGMDRFGSRRETTRLVRGFQRSKSARSAPVLEVSEGAPDWGPVERAKRQRELLQVALGEHPMASPEVASMLASWSPTPGGNPVQVHKLSSVPAYLDVQGVSPFFAGVVTSWRELERSKGRFGFATLEDESSSVEVPVWFSTFEAFRNQLPRAGDLMVVQGRVSVKKKREGEEHDPDVVQVVANSLYRLDAAAPLAAPAAARIGFSDVWGSAGRLLVEEPPKKESVRKGAGAAKKSAAKKGSRTGGRRADAPREPEADAPAPASGSDQASGPGEQEEGEASESSPASGAPPPPSSRPVRRAKASSVTRLPAPESGSLLDSADVVWLDGVREPVRVRDGVEVGPPPLKAAFDRREEVECPGAPFLRLRGVVVDGVRHVRVRTSGVGVPSRSEVRGMLQQLPSMG